MKNTNGKCRTQRNPLKDREGKPMSCNHERIKSVNCKLFCIDCGAELPPVAVPVAKVENNPPTEAKATEAKKTTAKRARKKVN